METTRKLNDGSILTVTTEGKNYQAKISSDTRNIGFDDDMGEIEGSETIDTIADGFAMFMNENLSI